MWRTIVGHAKASKYIEWTSVKVEKVLGQVGLSIREVKA
jgi:hypothetical protein